jgi:myo-inositol-1(or 4)-monophosphatase
LAKELEVALSAARRAGEVLRSGFGAEHAITYKGEVDLVTEVDEEAERVIREELLGAFPTHGMLAEEGGRAGGGGGRPLDRRSPGRHHQLRPRLAQSSPSP